MVVEDSEQLDSGKKLSPELYNDDEESLFGDLSPERPTSM
jgi:hypothetical protein